MRIRHPLAELAVILALAAGLGPSLLAQEPPSPPPAGGDTAHPLTLAEAIRIALAANPGLAAARLGRGIAQANVDLAAERPNPDLTFERTRETPNEAVTLALPVETAGKRQHRIELARQGLGRGEAELGRTEADFRNAVRRAFFTLVTAQRREVESDAVLKLAERAKVAADERFRTGAAPRLESLQAELAATQAESDAESARVAVIAARGSLDTFLGRSPHSPLVVRDELSEGGVPKLAEALALARSSSSQLAVLDHQIAEESAKVALARAQRYPDPTVQGSVTFHAPPDFDTGWRAALTVNLPIFNRHRAAIDVEERTLAQLVAQRAATELQIEGDVTAAVAQAEAQRDQMQRYRDRILPRSAEVESMAEDSYRSGQTGVVALLQTLQSSRDARLRAIQAGADFQNALADLEKAIGAPLP